jgi:RNA-directed DNA polymerase
VIWQKILDGDYKAVPAALHRIPKPDGGVREVMSFSIPDSALANVVHRTATKRNLTLFSKFSYAYRPDQNIFDAIIHLKRSMVFPKNYVVQYDFSKYFDSIYHD